MKSQGNTIFVGIKTNEKLHAQLDSSKSEMKSLFKDNNPEYLQILQIDDDEYIGKIIKSDISIEHLNNLLMNVKTMLKMICPKFVFTDTAFRILALTSIPSRPSNI